MKPMNRSLNPKVKKILVEKICRKLKVLQWLKVHPSFCLHTPHAHVHILIHRRVHRHSQARPCTDTARHVRAQTQPGTSVHRHRQASAHRHRQARAHRYSQVDMQARPETASHAHARRNSKEDVCTQTQTGEQAHRHRQACTHADTDRRTCT